MFLETFLSPRILSESPGPQLPCSYQMILAPRIFASLIKQVCHSPQSGEGERAVWPSRHFDWSGGVAACIEKYPGEGSSSLDRQVTDGRRFLAGKYSEGSQQKGFDRHLPAGVLTPHSLQALDCAGSSGAENA